MPVLPPNLTDSGGATEYPWKAELEANLGTQSHLLPDLPPRTQAKTRCGSPVSPGPAHRQQKGEGRQAAGTSPLAHGGRATAPRPRALQSPGNPEEPGKAGPSRRPPGKGPDSAGLPSPGGPAAQGEQETGREKGPRTLPHGPAGSQPGPQPTQRRAPSAARPRPPEAPLCARPIRRHRDASAAPAAPAARPGPAVCCRARPQAPLPAPALSRG